MFGAEKGKAGKLDGKDLYIGIVQARWNESITNALAKSCREELLALGVEEDNIDIVNVPGALEIPVALQALAEKGGYDALIAIGCVIRGETYHFELVANESAAAVTRVGIDHGLAIANAILTCDTPAQAQARADEKGRDAARVAVEMANLLDELS